MDDIHLIFEERINKIIESNGLNQRTFAMSLGLNNGTVSRWMNWQRIPDPKYLIMISQKYKVSVDWLLGLQDDYIAKLPEKSQELLSLYNIASSQDKLVIDTLLSRYKEKSE